MYLRPQDFPDGGLELERVVVVHRHDMRSADILFCVRVLRGHLRKATEGVGGHHTDEGARRTEMWGTHLSGGWLAPEKLVIERAVRWLKLGLEKYAAIGDGLQRSRAFVREAEAYEELKYKRTKTGF